MQLKKRILLALLSGGLICLSFPKSNLFFLAWFAWIPLFIAIHTTDFKKAFFLGWLTGTAAFCGILYWIVPTFRAAGISNFVGILSVFLLAGYIGIYFGLFTGISEKFFKGFHPLLYFSFSTALWVSLEYIRGHFLYGFPWALMGYSQWKMPLFIQISEWTGVYGVSAMVIYLNLWENYFPKKINLDRVNLFSIFAVCVFIAINFILAARASELEDGSRKGRLRIAILQGNIDQYKKWNAEFVKNILNTYEELSEEASRSGDQSLIHQDTKSPNLIIWPESALPGWFPQDEWLARWVEKSVKKTNTYHLVGSITQEENKNYNSAFLIYPNGQVRGKYDKMHLVPFGEFVPFQPLLGKWISVLNELGGFHPGKNNILDIPEAKLGVSICYEAIFPELIRKHVLKDAEIFVNITNDGWYLDTAAPEQHFSMNVFRAIENRKFLVRAANTGISGIISPSGRLKGNEISRLNERIVLSGDVEPNQRKTFYSRYGDIFAWLCCGLSVLGILYSFKSRRVAEATTLVL